ALSGGMLFASGEGEGGEDELGTEENPVIWSLVPSGDTQEIVAGGQELADMVYDRTDIVIEANVATEYAGVIEALGTDPPSAHMTSLATFAYVMAADRDLAESELVSVRYGRPFYDGQIIAGADTGIESVEDLEGASFARPDPASTSGWIIPMLTMRAEGIDTDSDLGEVVDVGGHTSVVTAVYSGDAEAGATYVDAREDVEEQESDVMDRVNVIEVSEPIPNDGVQFHPSVPDDIREPIVEALLEIAETEEGQEAMDELYSWEGFEELGDDFYDPFRQVLQASGMEAEELVED
ncbi:MAG: phosphate/phosphite/phosphonate ABC transporter substrate-binding protein, partial [Spirochaetales bacterium]